MSRNFLCLGVRGSYGCSKAGLITKSSLSFKPGAIPTTLSVLSPTVSPDSTPPWPSVLPERRLDSVLLTTLLVPGGFLFFFFHVSLAPKKASLISLYGLRAPVRGSVSTLFMSEMYICILPILGAFSEEAWINELTGILVAACSWFRHWVSSWCFRSHCVPCYPSMVLRTEQTGSVDSHSSHPIRR